MKYMHTVVASIAMPEMVYMLSWFLFQVLHNTSYSTISLYGLKCYELTPHSGHAAE